MECPQHVRLGGPITDTIAPGLFWLVSSDALTTGVLSIHCLGELPSGRAEVPNFLAAASEPSAGIAPKSTDAFFWPGVTSTRTVARIRGRDGSCNDPGGEP
jgi:hypothetical protein